MIVFGTRPEALKLLPLVKFLREHFNGSVEVMVCSTGQHKELLNPVFDLFQCKPNVNLNIIERATGLPNILSEIITSVSKEIEKFRPNLIMIQGDTSSALGAALASFYNQIPICHLEAGLRSYEFYEPFPEEAHRRLITQLSSFHLAPNESARSALVRESIDNSKIYVVGNTLEDSFREIIETVNDINLPIKFSDDQKLLLVTQHRRENIGDGLVNLCEALQQIVEINPDVVVGFIVHPNPQVKQIVYNNLQERDRIVMLQPQRYDVFISMLQQAALVLTDSGGLCEETALLNIPTLVTRKVTERQFLVDYGYMELVGNSIDMIVERALFYLSNQHKRPDGAVKYKDGNHSKFIAHLLVDSILPTVAKDECY